MAKNKLSYTFLIGLAVAIVLPLSFYVVAKFLKKDKLSMPGHYISESIQSHMEGGKIVRDTFWHQAGELQAINQMGDHISLNKDLPGKILVVDFFFTTCPSICPRLTRNMKLLQDAYKNTPMMRNSEFVQFISISVTPERDSFPALYQYAKKYGADNDHWWFLTGDKKALYDYARNELHLSVPDGNGGADDFIHTEQMVLLDKDRVVRGYFNGLDSLDVGKCAFAIGQLNIEKEHLVKKQ